MIVKQIVLHNSDTPDSGTVSWGNIRNYHVQVNGWQDIGYHFGIELARNSYEILLGRMPDMQGAHCRAGGRNKDSLGICFVGDFKYHEPHIDQWIKGLKLVDYLLRQFDLTPSNVWGHREFDDRKTCPGLMFDIDKFRNDLRQRRK